MLIHATVSVLTDFKKLNLSKELQLAISDMGFEKASAIQAQAIPKLMEGRDIIAQAQTGTGKTAAFGIPCIEKIDASNKQTQALIMCPTRELCVQVTNEMKKLARHHKNIYTTAIYGGQSINIQLKSLRKGSQIIVGTPGRIMDHMKRGTLKLGKLKYLVLDEADQMLDMGFREDMEDIITKTPKSRQTLMFSATMTPDLEVLMKRYQKDLIKISTLGEGRQNKQISQTYFNVKQANKTEVLKKLLVNYKIFSGIIFCNTKKKVDDLTRLLAKDDYKTAALHGDIPQRKRDRVMQNFKKGKVEFLVATDVAARGLDINDLEAVVNYDIPRADQDYVHRIGRTGRAGKKGLALSITTGREAQHMERIAKKNSFKINNAADLNIEEHEDIELETVSNKGSKSGSSRKRGFSSKSRSSRSQGSRSKNSRSRGPRSKDSKSKSRDSKSKNFKSSKKRPVKSRQQRPGKNKRRAMAKAA